MGFRTVRELLSHVQEEIPGISYVLQFGEAISHLEDSCRDFGVLRILLYDVVESDDSWIVLFLGIESFPNEILGIPGL